MENDEELMRLQILFKYLWKPNLRFPHASSQFAFNWRPIKSFLFIQQVTLLDATSCFIASEQTDIGFFKVGIFGIASPFKSVWIQFDVLGPWVKYFSKGCVLFVWKTESYA